MDPVTIACAVIGITSHCMQTAKAISGLRDKYKNAGTTITAIYTELTVVSASLGHIQGLISTNPATLEDNFQSRPELQRTFDQALTGCVLIFSVLDDEVKKLCEPVGKGLLGRVAYLWKEEVMKDLLQQIRGQQTALSLLVQAFQMSSVADIKALLQNNDVALEQAAQRSHKLRQAHPKIRAPPSVLDAVLDDAASVFSYDSTPSSTHFSFDDYLVNAQAYRRVLAASRSDLSRRTSGTKDSSQHKDDDTIVNAWPPFNGPDDSIAKLIREAVSTEESAIVKVTKKTGSSQDDEQIDILNMNKEWSDQVLKYKKVKRLYYEKDTELSAAQQRIEEARAENDRNQAERVTEKEYLESKLKELEHTKVFLLKKVDDLEQLDEANKRHFQVEEALRSDINEKHNALLFEKQNEIRLLLASLEALKKEAEEEKLRARERLDRIATVEDKIYAVESNERKLKNEIDSEKARNEELRREIAVKDAEMQRYKGFDAIIDQLRALSPPSSPSVPTSAPPSSSDAA